MFIVVESFIEETSVLVAFSEISVGGVVEPVSSVLVESSPVLLFIVLGDRLLLRVRRFFFWGLLA